MDPALFPRLVLIPAKKRIQISQSEYTQPHDGGANIFLELTSYQNLRNEPTGSGEESPMKKLVIAVAAFALSLAGADKFTVRLFQPTRLAGTELAPGDYRLVLND